MQTLPRSTRALLELLETRPPGPVLDIGSFQGAVARAADGVYVHVDLLTCNAARQAGVAQVIHSDLLPPGPFGTIAFDAREYDPALTAEMVAAAAARLAPGGVLLTTAPAAEVAASFSVAKQLGEAVLGRAPLPNPSGPDAEPRWSFYESEFGGRTYRLFTGPGVFAPSGLDAGTRAMLSEIRAEPGARFLDLGAGTGIVSRITYETWGCRVTAVDVNARALRLTALNAPHAEVIPSDGFAGLSGRQFDIIASNPPYHTDFAVAKGFIEGAFRHLEIGGTLYLVVKRADWYVQKVKHVFGGCRIVETEGYTVIIAQRRLPKPGAAEAAQPAATTRKHAKRLEAANKTKGSAPSGRNRNR